MTKTKKARVYALRVERENGDRDELELCADCLPSVGDFLKILGKSRSPGTCARCDVGDGDKVQP